MLSNQYKITQLEEAQGLGFWIADYKACILCHYLMLLLRTICVHVQIWLLLHYSCANYMVEEEGRVLQHP